MSYKFKLGQEVSFFYAPIKGIGVVRGIAIAELAVIGVTYIIETNDVYSKDYPYTSIAVPEIHLTKLNDYQED